MGLYYPDDYGPYVTTAVEVGGWRRALRTVVDPLDVAIPPIPPGRLLEIGTASGNFLVEMQRRGWDVTGVEVDPVSAARAAARTNSRVVCGDLLGVSFDQHAFDLVCAWMTLEHLGNPAAALDKWYSWLEPGGWLAFSVPDCGSWQFRFFREDWFALQLPTHLFHFTAPVLRTLLSRCGFVHTEVRWQRTLIDVAISAAYVAESRLGARVGGQARALAGTVPIRALSRVLGIAAAPFGLTGRLTVWARKPVRDTL
jgi:SAM-dependent methyltransferase